LSRKGRDGQTDIHGISLPSDEFRRAQKYPVIEQIYAGPQDFFVPKAWSRFGGQQALAEQRLRRRADRRHGYELAQPRVSRLWLSKTSRTPASPTASRG
jgi:hypothetical protein